MKLEGLPGIPRVWHDFLESKLPALPLPSSIGTIAANAPEVRTRTAGNEELVSYLSSQREFPRHIENVQRLKQPDAVVIVAEIAASLFGGPAAQILKCLTAIKICEELAKVSINAVPVCWIGTFPPAFSQWSVTLIDTESELHTMDVSPSEAIPDSISDALSQLSEIGGGSFDPETIESLGTAYVPGSSLSRSTARLFSSLMKDFGIITVDAGAPEIRRVLSGVLPPAEIANVPSYLLISSILPVLAFVAGPLEVNSLAQVMSSLDEAGLPRPSAWPQAGATFGDVKSRRAFERYRLDLAQLFSGEEEVLRGIKGALPRAGLSKLNGIKPEVERRVGELKSLFAGESRFVRRADSCEEKIIYQLEKVQKLFEASLDMKERIARRQIHKVCNLLAPNGRLQQSELAGIQLPLSYSRAGLRSFYEKLDIQNFEHQLIWMD